MGYIRWTKLIKHLKTRIDDSHARPDGYINNQRTKVRFFADCQIKAHDPPSIQQTAY